MTQKLVLNEKQMLIIKRVTFPKLMNVVTQFLGKSATSEVYYAVESAVDGFIAEINDTMRINDNLGTARKAVSKKTKYAKSRKN